MQELLVVDDKFTEQQLAVFAKHNIKLPKEGEIVTLVRIEKLKMAGVTSLIVSPYDGQFIVDKGFEKEVGFKKERFTTLLGKKLTDEMLDEEFQNQKKQQKVLVKPLKLDSNNPYNN